ncbi:MAG: DUF411 domain-containing protein [Pseudomonadales bacterium]
MTKPGYIIATLVVLAGTAFGLIIQTEEAGAEKPAMTVYKSATCGCCGDWVKHMQRAGFEVEPVDVQDLNAVKREHDVHRQLQSCHTGVTKDGYFFEGHIPAKVITAFLENPPDGAKGLAVPGMPMGSPGMEMGKFQPFDVLLVREDGSTSVYERIESPDYD